MRDKRKKIWIDRFQTHLSIRLVLYFVLYQAAVWSIVVLDRAIAHGLELLTGNAVLSYYFTFVGVGTVVVLGLLSIRDALRVSHRVVGPLHRFRKAIQAVKAGDKIELLRLRQGDYLQELKDDFNEMLEALEERGAVTLQSTGTKSACEQAGAIRTSPCAS